VGIEFGFEMVDEFGKTHFFLLVGSERTKNCFICCMLLQLRLSFCCTIDVVIKNDVVQSCCKLLLLLLLLVVVVS
jgi:hypothetical protein